MPFSGDKVVDKIILNRIKWMDMKINIYPQVIHRRPVPQMRNRTV
jgi:hypothetical protein